MGTGQTKYAEKRPDVNIPELAHEATRAALDSCGLAPKDIDAVVFGLAPETFDGVDCPDNWAADAVGALNKPYMRIHTGGATGMSAAIAAIAHIASGMFDTVLVIAQQRVSETPDAQFILNLTFDPIFGRDMALNLIASSAMDAVGLMETYGFTEWHMAKLASKNHRNALNNPYAHVQKDVSVEDCLKSPMMCWPLKLLDCSPRSDGACAVVLTAEEKASKSTRKPAWVLGYGDVCTQRTQGEKIVPKWFGYGESVQRAYKMAGIIDPRKEISVVEAYQPFSYYELISYQQFGFCSEPREAAKLVERGFGEMTGEVPFAPSGGVTCSNPIGATGLVRLAEAALQVMGDAGRRQVGNVRRALATGAGGSPGPVSGSFNNAMVLGMDKP